MTEGDLLSRYHELPAEALRQVIEFLHDQYACPRSAQENEPKDLARHGFVGAWKDREGMRPAPAGHEEAERKNGERELIEVTMFDTDILIDAALGVSDAAVYLRDAAVFRDNR